MSGMNEIPIACSLSGSDLQRRLSEIAAVGHEALLDATITADRAILFFRDDDDIKRRLQAIVAAESACCPFLQLRLGPEADGLTLAIAAPNGGGFAVGEFANAFGPSAGERSGTPRLS